MISNLNQISRAAALRLRKIQDQFYLFDAQRCYAINITGAIIFNAVGNDMPVDELCKKLSEKFTNIDTINLSQDVENFIDFLLTEGLVELK